MQTKSSCSVAVVTGFALIAGAYGCGSEDVTQAQGGTTQVTDDGDDGTATELDLGLLVSAGTGLPVPGNLFAKKGDVFFRVHATVDNPVLTAQDFVFELRDRLGVVTSTDDMSCRTFHVTEKGKVDRVYQSTHEGVECTHRSAALDDGSLVVNVLPFADIPANGDGAMEFTLLAAPKADFPLGAIKTTFTVKTNETGDGDGDHTCGCGNGVVDAGEGCDDGNVVDGDGCSMHCTVETPPPAPVCGNGMQEAGEACDDGNADEHDGCNSMCQLCDDDHGNDQGGGSGDDHGHD